MGFWVCLAFLIERCRTSAQGKVRVRTCNAAPCGGAGFPRKPERKNTTEAINLVIVICSWETVLSGYCSRIVFRCIDVHKLAHLVYFLATPLLPCMPRVQTPCFFEVVCVYVCVRVLYECVCGGELLWSFYYSNRVYDHSTLAGKRERERERERERARV